jgi:hypothetical protein
MRWQNWRFPRCEPSPRFGGERKGGLIPQNETDKQLVIEWSQAAGFGISNKSFKTFGETADEHITSVNDVHRRVEQLLTTAEWRER